MYLVGILELKYIHTFSFRQWAGSAFQTYIYAFANNCPRNFLFEVHSHKTQQVLTIMEGRRDADPPIM